MMLKGVPSILSPELLKILMEMGHGDEIVLGDGNFASASMAQRVLAISCVEYSDLYNLADFVLRE